MISNITNACWIIFTVSGDLTLMVLSVNIPCVAFLIPLHQSNQSILQFRTYSDCLIRCAFLFLAVVPQKASLRTWNSIVALHIQLDRSQRTAKQSRRTEGEGIFFIVDVVSRISQFDVIALYQPKHNTSHYLAVLSWFSWRLPRT